MPLTPGTSVTWGDARLANPTDQTIYIDSVTVKATDRQLLRHVVVTHWHRSADGKLNLWHDVFNAAGQYASPLWPPKGTQQGDLVAPSQATIPPDDKWVNVVSQLVTPALGSKLIAGPIIIDYHVGTGKTQQRYQLTFDARAVLCGVPSAYVGETCTF